MKSLVRTLTSFLLRLCFFFESEEEVDTADGRATAGEPPRRAGEGKIDM